MRIKVVIVVLLAGMLGIGAIFYLRKPAAQPKPEPEQVVEVTETPKPAPVPAPKPLIEQPAPRATVAVVETNAPVTTASNAVVEANEPEVNPVVQAKIDRLQELSANYDKESLKEILTELINPDPQIRHAAIEATEQFRDRAAIPVLKELAAQTSDPGEREELLEAADFLALPTYTEVMQAKREAKAAAQNAGQQ